jgi:hypothetical protein
MCEHQTDESQPKSSVAVFELPGRITDGRCSWCSEDLSYLFEKIEQGEIPPPSYCPHCSKPLRTDEIFKEIWQCKKCRTEILDPEKEIHCRGCGRKLVYPPEALCPKEG